jgi:hypothetical protein
MKYNKQSKPNLTNSVMKSKIEELQYIDNYIYDNMDKVQLRNLVYELLVDDSLLRSFKLFK